jgi:hypothetical protein
MSNYKKLESAVDHLEDMVDSLSLTGGIVVDVTKINTQAITANSGNLAAGTQRVCIATNDVNMAAINANSLVLSNCVDQINNHVEVDTNAINGVTIDVNAGNNSAGTQRMCIATDDVNIAAMKTKIDDIYTILNDVYNAGAGTLNVTVVP